MPYIKKNALVRSRRSMMGFGDFTDESLCSSIPAGDSYRKPGNYCNTGDGGYTTFNADGSTYVTPGSSSSSSSSSPGVLNTFLNTLLGANKPPMPGVPVVAPGMSMTTKIALAGGAVLLAAVILRR